MEVDDILGSLSRLSDKIWFKAALDQHNAGKCMDLFKVYCIGLQFMTEDGTVMISFSSVWSLLNFWRSVSSSYNKQDYNGRHPQMLHCSSQQAWHRSQHAQLQGCSAFIHSHLIFYIPYLIFYVPPLIFYVRLTCNAATVTPDWHCPCDLGL